MKPVQESLTIHKCRNNPFVIEKEDEKKELETSSRVSEEQDSTDDEVLLLDPDSHLHSTKLPASVSESFPNSPASITHRYTRFPVSYSPIYYLVTFQSN